MSLPEEASTNYSCLFLMPGPYILGFYVEFLFKVIDAFESSIHT